MFCVLPGGWAPLPSARRSLRASGSLVPVKRFLLLCPWFALLAFPLVEVSAHAITRSRVPKLRDWQAAAAYVKPRVGPRDLVSVAPAWADPLLREVLGAQIDLPMAGRSDTSFYERLWSLSIRGARPAEAPPDETQLLEQRAFGRVQVALWSLGKSRVRFRSRVPEDERRVADIFQDLE